MLPQHVGQTDVLMSQQDPLVVAFNWSINSYSQFQMSNINVVGLIPLTNTLENPIMNGAERPLKRDPT